MKNTLIFGIFGILFLVVAVFNVRAQESYVQDRVYTGNQVSNTVSVIDPATNTLLGEIVLGKPQTNVLSPLYRGQSLVHGLGYSPVKQMLAVVAIGSNSVTLIGTNDNTVLKTVYVGRAPHEATFHPAGTEVWVTVRGESYVSVIDVQSLKETQQIQVSDGPGMVAFTPDGNFAYCCSSFSPFVDVIDTRTYKVVHKIAMPSSFSPNIFMSPDGKLVAVTLKDIGKVVVIDTKTNTIILQIATGPITNHVTFALQGDKLLMPVTVGGQNCVKVYNATDGYDYELIATIATGTLPHGEWASADGKRLYVGLEYMDTVQPIDLETMTAMPVIQTGQSPQALLYAVSAVTTGNGKQNLRPLQDPQRTQVIVMKSLIPDSPATGQLAVRPIGLADLVEQLFLKLQPNTAYTLSLSKSETEPYTSDHEINSFITDENGKFTGQSTGLVKSTNTTEQDYQNVVLVNKTTGLVVMIGKVE